MRTILKASLVWSGILLSLVCHGQEIPLGALPMQFNPSFAGEAGGPRFNSNFGLNAGGGNRDNSYRFNASYDQFIPAIRSGIGFSGGYSNFSGPFSSSTGYNLALAVAPKFSLKGKYTVSPSLDLSYGNFNNTIHNWYNTGESQQISGFNLKSRAGLMINTNKWFVGYAIDIPLHNTYQYDNPTAFPLNTVGKFNSYWHFGYTFQRSAESKFSFTPQLVFRTGWEGDGMGGGYNRFRYFAPVAYNLNFRYQKFIWGINNAGIHLGWQTDRVRVMLSNGGSNAGLDGFTYTGNATFRYMLKQSDR